MFSGISYVQASIVVIIVFVAVAMARRRLSARCSGAINTHTINKCRTLSLLIRRAPLCPATT
jgi:hypothetical protein